MPLLIKELNEFKLEWNTHRIRYDAKSHCPSGCPDDNYFLPELNGTRNFGFNVNEEDYTYIYEKYCSNLNLNEYITIQRKNELEGIVTKILNVSNNTQVDITNARQVYYILRTYLHQV
jgi:hypothetical protein